MVFPSPGCQTCRKRKIKCDCTRPLCQRCRIGNRKCDWNSDEQTGLHFRSENAFAMGLARRQNKSSGNPTSLPTDSASNFTPILNCSRIQPALSLPLEMHALYYYAESVSTERHMPRDVGNEYGSHVLPYWELAGPDSCLRLALMAYSHAVFGRNRGVGQALSLAQRVYARTVEKIQEAMRGISGDTIYQVMLAMMLMGGYENVMYLSRESTELLPSDAVGSRFWKSICHEKGAAGLLGTRRERGFAANPQLDKAIRRKCLRIIILRGAAMPGWLEDGRSWGEEGHELQLDSLMVRVLKLRKKSMFLLGDMEAANPETVDEINSVAKDAYTLDHDLASWPLGLPRNWTLSQPSLNMADGRLDIPSHSYPSVGHAVVWNQYRALRLITNSIQKHALAALQTHSNNFLLDTTMQHCQNTINELAVDMCRGTEFSITSQTPARGSEAFTLLDTPPHPSVAALLTWPLTVAVSVDAVQTQEKIWLKGALKAVARSLGHTLLNSVADQGEFRF